MSWIGDLFSSVSGGAGSALGGLPFDLYGAGAADRANRRSMQKQYDLGVQFDSTAIQRRVADAEKAGVHPLFALGASPAQGPSLSVVPSEKGEAFRAVSRSIGNRLTPMDRALQMAQLESYKASSYKDRATADYYASEAARVKQQSFQTGPAPPDSVQGKPDEVTSARKGVPSQTAGEHPGVNTYIGPFGWRWSVPDTGGQGLGETFENMGEIAGGPLALVYTYLANLEDALINEKKRTGRGSANRRVLEYFSKSIKKYPSRGR